MTGMDDATGDVFALVHAPVLGPASWEPAAAELARLTSRPVVVPSLAGFSAGGPPYAPRLIRAGADEIARLAGGARRIVLVVHSGAGPLAGQLAAATADAVAAGARADTAAPPEAGTGSAAGAGASVGRADPVASAEASTAAGTGAGTDGAGTVAVGVIFADAGLPRGLAGGGGPTPVVDGQFLPYLREIARDGVVPPWPQWWPGVDPAEIFPSEEARAAVLADARPLPLAFFEEEVPAVALPGPAGYLLFSEGYGAAAMRARELGWPVRELAGSHLHLLVRPEETAAAVAALAAELSW